MLEDGESTRAALTPDPGAVTVIVEGIRSAAYRAVKDEVDAWIAAAREGEPALLPAGYSVTLLEAAPPPPDSFAQGLVVPRTPALDKLWTRIDTYTPSRSMPDAPQFDCPLPSGIEASRECTACGGTGAARRTRERSAVAPTPGAAAARAARDKRHASGVPLCRPCEGKGWISFDALPKGSASGSSAKQLRTDNDAPHGLATTVAVDAVYSSGAPFEFIADAELRRWRALRALTRRSRDVGDAWARRYEDGSLAPLPLTSVWPLTTGGRLAFAWAKNLPHYFGEELGRQCYEAADREAVTLLEQAEAEARAALASQGLGVRSTATLESESE
jgi:hypothetical protein